MESNKRFDNHQNECETSSTSSTCSISSDHFDQDDPVPRHTTSDPTLLVPDALRKHQTVSFSTSTSPNTSYASSEVSINDDLEVAAREASDIYCRPLQDQILEIIRKIPGHKEKKGFLPEDELTKLMTEERVTKELHRCFQYLDLKTIKGFAKRICGTTSDHAAENMTFVKIFAILILCERPKAMPRFLEEMISDRDLPLVKLPTSKATPNLYNLTRKGCSNKLECFRGWTHTAAMRFEEWQWTTIAPFFRCGGRKNNEHLVLQDQAALPFEYDSRFASKSQPYQRLEFEGGFSNVFKVRIHHNHHNLCKPDDPEPEFAVKCLLSRDRDEFSREVDTLVKFSGDAHPHLVSLLATYEQFGRFYMMFPWAQADLQGYWARHSAPSLNQEAINWLAEQCSGIAGGLAQIHRYETTEIKRRTTAQGIEAHLASTNKYDLERLQLRQRLFGRHGDIKPENILWFKDANKKNDRGVLKISDFGLAEFSARHSQCYKRNSQVAHSPSYKPPECDLEGATVGQSYDIWTLGCLYLELITWQLGGLALLQAFRKARSMHDPMRRKPTATFFEIVRCERTQTVGAMVKPRVIEFIQLELHAHQACTEYFHEFIHFIWQEMLVVKSPNPKERGRASIERVRARLCMMLKKCREDAGYALEPRGWPQARNDCKKLEEAVEADVAKETAEILQWNELRTHTGKTLVRASTMDA